MRRIYKSDKKHQFYFCPLQSEKGRALTSKFELESVDSIVLIQNDKAYIESEAAFEIFKKLSGIYKVLLIFSILPKSLTDIGYRFIARNRYRVFGKDENCEIPSPHMKDRFIS